MEWLNAYAASGITGIVSAGETHVPSRPSDPQGVKALAVLTHKIFSSYRARGRQGLCRRHYPRDRPDRAGHQGPGGSGHKPHGRVWLGNAVDPDTAGLIAQWGVNMASHPVPHRRHIPGRLHRHEYRTHPGHPADVICHVAGGGIPIEGMRRFVEELPSWMEICAVNRPSPKFCKALVDMLREKNQFHRLLLGTDTPSGYGIFPHGVWEVITLLCGLCGLEPEVAIAAGSRQHRRLLRHPVQHRQAGLCR